MARAASKKSLKEAWCSLVEEDRTRQCPKGSCGEKGSTSEAISFERAAAANQGIGRVGGRLSNPDRFVTRARDPGGHVRRRVSDPSEATRDRNKSSGGWHRSGRRDRGNHSGCRDGDCIGNDGHRSDARRPFSRTSSLKRCGRSWRACQVGQRGQRRHGDGGVRRVSEATDRPLALPGDAGWSGLTVGGAGGLAGELGNNGKSGNEALPFSLCAHHFARLRAPAGPRFAAADFRDVWVSLRPRPNPRASSDRFLL